MIFPLKGAVCTLQRSQMRFGTAILRNITVGTGTLFHAVLDTSLNRTCLVANTANQHFERICQASSLSCATRVKNLSRHKVPFPVRPLRNASRPFGSAELAVTLRNMQKVLFQNFLRLYNISIVVIRQSKDDILCLLKYQQFFYMHVHLHRDYML